MAELRHKREELIDKIQYFICPVDKNHKVDNIEKWRKHVEKCARCTGMRFYKCQFFFYHVFDNQNEKNNHEVSCDFRFEQPILEIQNDYIQVAGQLMLNKQNQLYNQLWYEKNRDMLKKDSHVYKSAKTQGLKELEQEYLEKVQNKKKEQVNQFIKSAQDNFENFLFYTEQNHKIDLQMCYKGLINFDTSLNKLKGSNLMNYIQFLETPITRNNFNRVHIGNFISVDNDPNFEEIYNSMQKNTIYLIEEKKEEIIFFTNSNNSRFSEFVEEQHDIKQLVLISLPTNIDARAQEWLEQPMTQISQQEMKRIETRQLMQTYLREKQKVADKELELEKIKLKHKEQLAEQQNEIESTKVQPQSKEKRLKLREKIDSEIKRYEQKKEQQINELKKQISNEFQIKMKQIQDQLNMRYQIYIEKQCTDPKFEQVSNELSEYENDILNLKDRIAKMKEKAIKDKEKIQINAEDVENLREELESKQQQTANLQRKKDYNEKSDFNYTSEKSNNMTCIICKTNMRDLVFMNCNHMLICYGCYCQSENITYCQICKIPIKRIIQIIMGEE